MKNKLLLILSLTAALNVSAKCIPAVEEQYTVLSLAVITGNVALRNSLVEKYCLNFPQFYKESSKSRGSLVQAVKARSIEDLKVYYLLDTSISLFSEGSYEKDLLSYAVSPYHQVFINEEEIKLGEKYLAKGEKINAKPKKLTKKEHDELMSYIVKAYNKEGYTFTDTSDRSNMLHYVIYANNPKVLNNLMSDNSYRSLYLYKKNITGLTPIHFAFAKKNPYHEEAQEIDTPEMNDFLIRMIPKERVQLLTYNAGKNFPALTFFEFAELMKDENPDFYKKLKNKFNFSVNISEEKKKQLQPILAKSLVLQNLLFSYYKLDSAK